jgi:hypothetical protein
MTPLAVATKVLPVFEAAGVPVQSPTHLAEKVVGLNCDSSMNGKVLYVLAGRAYNIEVGMQRTMPEWLGPEIMEMNEKVREQRMKMSRM